MESGMAVTRGTLIPSASGFSLRRGRDRGTTSGKIIKHHFRKLLSLMCGEWRTLHRDLSLLPFLSPRRKTARKCSGPLFRGAEAGPARHARHKAHGALRGHVATGH